MYIKKNLRLILLAILFLINTLSQDPQIQECRGARYCWNRIIFTGISAFSWIRYKFDIILNQSFIKMQYIYWLALQVLKNHSKNIRCYSQNLERHPLESIHWYDQRSSTTSINSEDISYCLFHYTRLIWGSAVSLSPQWTTTWFSYSTQIS